MAINLDKFLICDKKEKTLYNEEYGYITIRCIPKKFTLTRYINDIESELNNRYGYYGSNYKEIKTSIENIFYALRRERIENGRKVVKFEYKEFSFVTPKTTERIDVVVKEGEKYYRLYNNSISFSNVYITSDISKELFKKLTGTTGNEISITKFREILENHEWVEDDKEVLFTVENINDLKPKTRIFLDGVDGGEGEIISIKEFNAIDKKAIFEIKLFNGKSVDFNFFGTEKRDNYNRIILDKTLIKIFIKKGQAHISEPLILELEESINENLLSPFVRKLGANGINVYWQAVDNVSCYNVELYTYNPESVGNKLYKMETKTIDRNCFYTVFANLANGKYGVKIFAEDRAGKVVSTNKIIIITI